MENPITSIEDEKAQTDLGIFAARVFQGAFDECGGDWWKAFYASAALWQGMFRANQSPPDGEDAP